CTARPAERRRLRRPTALPGRAGVLARDGELRLGDAARAAAEVAQLVEQEDRLVPVGPLEEDAPVAERLDAHETLRLGRDGGVAPRDARLARAGAAERRVGEDAVVAVGPLDAERVAPDLGEPLDVGRLRRAARHGNVTNEGAPPRQPARRLGRSIRASD